MALKVLNKFITGLKNRNFNSSCIYKELIDLLVYSGHERTAFLSTLVWLGLVLSTNTLSESF